MSCYDMHCNLEICISSDIFESGAETHYFDGPVSSGDH